MIASTIQGYYPDNYTGVLLEVGAGFPEMGNPVSPLRKLGWNIISVEPNPVLCNEFRSMNLPVLEYAAYNKDIGETKFMVSPNGLSYSSLKLKKKYPFNSSSLKGAFNSGSSAGNNLSKNFDWKFFPREGKAKTIKVTALTLNTILKKHYPSLKKIDVIVVDVEGFELEAIQGIDLEKYNPEVVVLENLSGKHEYGSYMELMGFVFDKKISIDEFYIKKNQNNNFKQSIMETLDEMALRHHTDKASSHHCYARIYEQYLSSWRDKEFIMLEIGVASGASIRLWREYFPKAKIYGIDIDKNCAGDGIFIGSQTDAAFLNDLLNKIGKPDIIIDDGSHYAPDVIFTFKELFPKMANKGLYFVEDFHCAYCPTYGLAPEYGKGMSEVYKFFSGLDIHVDVYGRSMTGNSENAINSAITIPPVPAFSPILESIHIHTSLRLFRKK